MRCITKAIEQIFPRGGGTFEEEGRPVVKYRDSLPWAAQKRLNRSRCRLRRGLGWAKGRT